jgi:outer membrane protein assembly factor BamB
MNNAITTRRFVSACVVLLCANCVWAQDWPQWRGLNRDGKVTGFKTPETWPKELKEKWKVTVGNGDATPALVGEKLYVFSRQDGNEVLRCLDAATGKEIWKESYAAQGATPPAAGPHEGPRSSPTVADGKVVTLGVRGVLSCFDALSGKLVWRKDDVKGTPRFFVSSSPIVVDGLCIAELGSDSQGGIVAYDLATGDEKWKWTGDGAAYSSPVVLNVDGGKVIFTETATRVVGIAVPDGKLLWETPFEAAKGAYNAATPMVEGQTVIYSGKGRGTKAVKFEKEGDKMAPKELWTNKETAVQFNTPVIKDSAVFGLTDSNNLFCITANGKTAWTAPAPKAPAAGRMAPVGFGSVVDAGNVLFALTPAGKLIVFQPTDKEYKEIASYKVAEKDTYAYPVISGKRVLIKDGDSVTLWMIE